jgi:cytoplasmic iron level regulating protein YaaA (DUF328/UPF0246 family)
MKIILSPAKRLNTKIEEIEKYDFRTPLFLEKSEMLISEMQKKNKKQIAELMKISPDLARLNFDRYQSWFKDYTKKDGKPAIFMLEGDAYRGLNIRSFTQEQLQILDGNLMILSGLYGVIRPLDYILPYRLEMGVKLKIKNNKNLYDFWSNKLTTFVKKELKNERLIDLASKEYSSVIRFKDLKKPVLKIDFLQEKTTGFKNIAIYSKRARGLMTAFICKNNLKNTEDIRAFNEEDYYFNNRLSSENHFVFVR